MSVRVTTMDWLFENSFRLNYRLKIKNDICFFIRVNSILSIKCNNLWKGLCLFKTRISEFVDNDHGSLKEN